jgi:hypothetical protein
MTIALSRIPLSSDPVTTWERLVANSTLGSGTAWQHLQNQRNGTGGGGTTVIYINDGITVELVEMELVAQLSDDGIAVDLEDAPLEITLDDSPIVAEIEE